MIRANPALPVVEELGGCSPGRASLVVADAAAPAVRRAPALVTEDGGVGFAREQKNGLAEERFAAGLAVRLARCSWGADQSSGRGPDDALR
jgi:hypothetical protein